jgi:glycosyltransferase involved in cell wall biosynthesis
MIRPGPRENGFRRRHGLDGSFVVSFAGVMGYSQALDTVIEAARELKDRKDLVFLLVGDGVEKEGLVSRTRHLGLGNVLFLPMQPRERYPDVLAASDVCLVTLRGDVHTPVVPSKIPSIMAAGRPMVASMPLGGDGPRLIKEAECGIVVPPEDPQSLARAIRELHRSAARREALGRNGRKYAEQHLSREACVGMYERLLLELVEGDPL